MSNRSRISGGVVGHERPWVFSDLKNKCMDKFHGNFNLE